MITDAQYARLPEVLRQIVDIDQQRAAVRAPAVISFEAVRGFAGLQARRDELRRIARSKWGHNLNKNAAHATRRPEDDYAELDLSLPDGDADANG